MIVVDSSAVMSVLLDEEEGEAVMSLLSSEETLHAPALLPYEVLNVAAASLRRRNRGRAAGVTLGEVLEQFLSWPWAFESHCSTHALGAVSAIASRHGLTGYDAAYVELAVRRRCPLVTFDAAMRAAAKAEGVEVRP